MLILFCFEMGSHVVQASLKPSVQLRITGISSGASKMLILISGYFWFLQGHQIICPLYFLFLLSLSKEDAMTTSWCYLCCLFFLIHQVLCENTYLEKFPQVSWDVTHKRSICLCLPRIRIKCILVQNSTLKQREWSYLVASRFFFWGLWGLKTGQGSIVDWEGSVVHIHAHLQWTALPPISGNKIIKLTSLWIWV